MKNLILLFLISFLVCNCWYKNNDTLSLQLVKTRLQKTWILKEGIRDGMDVTIYNPNQEISFTDVKANEIFIKRPYGSVYYKFGFKNNKTTIFPLGQNSDELKIIKLTGKELWMEGRNIIGVLGGSTGTDVIKVKYNAK